MTRRALFSGIAAGGLAAVVERGKIFSADWQRFPDPATELEVYRLTDPAYISHLPAYYGHAVSHRSRQLLFSSDRAGSMQAFLMDQRSGEWRQLTEVSALDASSLNLMPDERSCCFFDGPSLHQLNLVNLRQREIYRVPEGFQRGEGAAVTKDGLYAVFAEAKNVGSRLRLVNIAKRTAQTVTEAPFLISDPIPRPKRTQILYRQGDEALWLVNFDGQQNRKLKLAPGRIGPALWSPDGRTVLYLNFPAERGRLNAIREATPDENLDKLVAATSQFAHFGLNGNASVFVGASQNKAAPHILILLRLTRRELTLCEHRASDASKVAPVFSPDSRYIYFHSDKAGKLAIYRMLVEKLVEPTESES